MKHQPFGRDTVVLLIMAFGYGALFAWGLSTPPTGKPSATPPVDWPAWVQAVGSVLAICAAVLIARWQRISERLDAQRRETLEARSLGAVLLRDIKRFRSNLERGISRLDSAGPTEGIPVNKQIVPDELWARVADIHRLGDPGSDLLRAIFHQQEARDIVERGILWPEEREAYLEQMHRALELCETTINGIRAMAR